VVFERLGLVYSDFKEDQLAVGVDGILKIVDFKSLKNIMNFHSPPVVWDLYLESWRTKEESGVVGILVSKFGKRALVEMMVEMMGNARKPDGMEDKFKEDIRHLLRSVDNPDPKKRMQRYFIMKSKSCSTSTVDLHVWTSQGLKRE